MIEGIFSLSNIPVLLIFLTVILVCNLYMRRRSKLPPGPPAIPLIGHLLWFRQIKRKGIRQYVALTEASKIYGDVLSFTVVGQTFVFLHGYDTIRDAFVKNSDIFSDRPNWLKYVKESTKEGKGVVWQTGNDYKVTRKLVLQALRDFGVGKTSLEEKIMREVDAATEFLSATNGKPTDVRLLTSMMISNVIYEIIFGKRFNYDAGEFHTLIEKQGILLKGDGAISPVGLLPPLVMKYLSSERFRILQMHQQAIRWIQKHIYEQIEQHETTFDNENLRDFVDLYLQAKNQQPDKNVTTKGNMFRVILDLFIAGSETTSNTINWCILYMQEYPEIQRKCQDEISEIFGHRVVRWADRSSLPYIEATLLEIQRMANIAPLSVPHTNEVDTTFRGYFIPRRTLILANLYSSNMDPRHWDQPEVFNPDRFIENGKVKKNPALIPFSTGPRMCLGESLAKMEMFLIFTNLLQRFTFRREDDNVKHSFENILDQVTSAPLPYKTRAVKLA